MAWTYLLTAGLLEIIWAVAMKQSAGFTRPLPVILMLVAMPTSLALLTLSMRTLPLGTAYAVWTGVGAMGAFLVGIVALGEQATPMRLGAAALILSGLVLMKLSAEG